MKESQNRNEVIEALLNMLKFIDQVCADNHIVYYLAYGSLLGAVRHQGFIPWDDDLDIWMPRDDYLRFLNVMNEKRHKRYILSVGKDLGIANKDQLLQMKVLDSGTAVERKWYDKVIETYLWIDIFCLDDFLLAKKKRYYRNNRIKAIIFTMSRWRLIEGKSNSGLKDKGNKIIYRLNRKFGGKIPWFNEDKSGRRLFQSITKYKGKVSEKDDEFFCYASVYMKNIRKCFFKKIWFGTPQRLLFEGQYFNGPANPNAILHTLYGDYTQLPPEKDRHNHGIRIIKNGSNA